MFGFRNVGRKRRGKQWRVVVGLVTVRRNMRLDIPFYMSGLLQQSFLLLPVQHGKRLDPGFFGLWK
jgi:hypothetical protein